MVYDPPNVTTHSKLLIVDGQKSLVGSTNWTYSALTRNHEVSVIVSSPEVARSLEKYFLDVWNTCRSLN